MTRRKSSFRGKVGRDVQKQEQASSSYGYLNIPKGISLFKEEGGSRVSLDIIPYIVTDEKHMNRDDEYEVAIPGELWYKKPFFIHRNIGPQKDSVVCPTTWGKRCPICEYRAKQFKEGADKEVTDALKTSLRNLYVVVPLDHKKLDEKPHLWDISQFLFQELLNKEVKEDEAYEDFPDLENGMTLKVRFDSVSLGTNKFAETSRIDFKERDYKYDEEFLEEIPDLDSVLKEYSYKELEKMFFELEDESEEPEEETRSYRKAKDDEPDEEPEEKPKRTRKRKDSDPEPDEEPEEKPRRTRKAKDSDPEEEPEEKPKRTRKPKKDDDEEPEEEKPKRTRKSDKGSSGKEKCPHGYKFGVDTEDYDECTECEIWDDCIEEKEKK